MSDPHRRAALTLHGLAGRDRDWLLARLDAGDRRAVRALLGELDDMRIPSETALMEEAAATAVPPPAAERERPADRGDDEAASPLARIAQVQADDMVRALEGEPDALIASVLALDDWPWRAALLSRLGPERATRIAGLAGEGSGPAPLARAALAEALVNRLELLATEGGDFPTAMRVAERAPARRRRWFFRLMPWPR